MATKVGRVFATAAGAGIGFIVGGPAGAASGAAYGAGLGFGLGHSIDAGVEARKQARHIAGQHAAAITGQAIKADEMARKQAKESERLQQNISRGHVRAAQRRVRGGLFGDSQTPQYSVSRLGG